jgi:hypothetical protein
MSKAAAVASRATPTMKRTRELDASRSCCTVTLGRDAVAMDPIVLGRDAVDMDRIMPRKDAIDMDGPERISTMIRFVPSCRLRRQVVMRVYICNARTVRSAMDTAHERPTNAATESPGVTAIDLHSLFPRDSWQQILHNFYANMGVFGWAVTFEKAAVRCGLWKSRRPFGYNSCEL